MLGDSIVTKVASGRQQISQAGGKWEATCKSCTCKTKNMLRPLFSTCMLSFISQKFPQVFPDDNCQLSSHHMKSHEKNKIFQSALLNAVELQQSSNRLHGIKKKRLGRILAHLATTAV